MATKQSTKISIDGKKISVNCIDWDIKLAKPDFKSADMCEEYGLFEKRRNLITIQDKTDQVTEFNTLLHEILHGVCWLGSLNSSGQPLDTEEKEELVVNALNWYIDNLYKNKVIN